MSAVRTGRARLAVRDGATSTSCLQDGAARYELPGGLDCRRTCSRRGEDSRPPAHRARSTSADLHGSYWLPRWTPHQLQRREADRRREAAHQPTCGSGGTITAAAGAGGGAPLRSSPLLRSVLTPRPPSPSLTRHSCPAFGDDTDSTERLLDLLQ